MLKIDSHQHFWIFDPVRDNWITEDMGNIRRDFLPEDLKPNLEQNDISACVAVQADQSELETKFLLDLAETNDFIKGVVGWVDLLDVNLIDRLNHWKTFPKLKGFRHIIQAERPGFMLNKTFLKGISALTEYGFTYDILVKSTQILEAVKLVELNPGQNFVLDHLGKPPIKSGEIKSWAAEIKELAQNENVSCKLSGLVTEADLSDSTSEDFRPYLDVVMHSFGIDRLMFGSDWPVCKLAAEYAEVIEIIDSFIDKLSSHEQEAVWYRNAVDFYSLDIK